MLKAVLDSMLEYPNCYGHMLQTMENGTVPLSGHVQPLRYLLCWEALRLRISGFGIQAAPLTFCASWDIDNIHHAMWDPVCTQSLLPALPPTRANLKRGKKQS